MSRDRTLKTRGGLAVFRSVLKRAERIVRLVDEGEFDPEGGCPLGLPKTKLRHSKAGTKTKKVEEKPVVLAEGEVAPVEAGETAPAAPGAKPPAGKPAAAAAKAPTGKPAPSGRPAPGVRGAPGSKPAGPR